MLRTWKELGELSDRLLRRALPFGGHESLHPRSTDPRVDFERQSAQQVAGAAMSSDLLRAAQPAAYQLVVLRLEVVVLCGELVALRWEVVA